MKYSDEKRAIINYVSKLNESKPTKIFDGTFAELREMLGADFDGFSERSVFPIQNENGKTEKVEIVKMTTNPFSNEVVNEYTVSPIDK